MRRVAVVAALLAVAGCQDDDAASYDGSARAKARAIAPTVPFGGYGLLRAVGDPRELTECAGATSFRAGPCLDAVVTKEVPVLDGSGDSVPIRSHVYVWLEKQEGRWVVSHTSFGSDDVAVELVDPASTGSGSSIAPPWMTGPNYGP